MIVCILNPNQQLQINNFQKDFILKNFNFCKKIFKNYQNMILLNSFKNLSTDFSTIDLKSISNSIKKITVFEPKIEPFLDDFSTEFYNKKTQFDFSLTSRIQLIYDHKTDFIDYPLAFFNLKDNSKSDFIEANKKNGTNIFPMQIKVFRIGNCLCQNNTFVLEDSVWKKLK